MPLTFDQLERASLGALGDECKRIGLPTSGSRMELVIRLGAHLRPLTHVESSLDRCIECGKSSRIDRAQRRWLIMSGKLCKSVQKGAQWVLRGLREERGKQKELEQKVCLAALEILWQRPDNRYSYLADVVGRGRTWLTLRRQLRALNRLFAHWYLRWLVTSFLQECYGEVMHSLRLRAGPVGPAT